MNMPTGRSLNRGEPFRPFFWVDGQFRVRAWPDVTARACHRPARAAIGRHCWEVVGPHGHARRRGPCAACPILEAGAAGAAEPVDAFDPPPDRCAALPLAGPDREAIVWLPLSRLARGTAGGARIEALVLRGALAGRLDSIESMLDGLRRACGADDCELFLIAASGQEVYLVDCAGRDREAFLEQTRMPLGTGYPGTVAMTRKPMFTNRFQQDRLFLRDAVKRRGIHSFLGFPLLQAGKPLGYVGLGWRHATVSMDWSLKLLEDVEPLLPLALRNRPPAPGEAGAVADLGLRCFGAFEILCNGHPVPLATFPRRKAVDLLKILVLQRGVPMHRDQLIELLWPGVTPQVGMNRLHGVLNVLRSQLEPGRRPGASSYVVSRDDRYHFNTAARLSVDLYDFLDLVADARRARRRGDPELAVGRLEEAVGLYRGTLFADADDNELVDLHRVRLRHAYLDAVRTVAGWKLRHDAHAEGIQVLQTALALEPDAVDLQEMLIAELLAAGRLSEARQQYESCRVALRRYLDMDLSPRTRMLTRLLY
jgi:two-component SAPR family response regulator